MEKAPHIYRDYNNDQLEELFSNYLVDSWSFSKISSFARNEKAFEMSYIYYCPYKSSATTVAGQAYHVALDFYFQSLKEGPKKDIVDLQMIAFNHIEDVKLDSWKTQKTTPTIEECRLKAIKVVNSLLDNFFYEIKVYDIKEVLYSEMYFDEFLTINGVDIPLPCHAKIDLIVKTNDGKKVIIDHKSKASFSDEKELSFSVGKQAITYYHIVKAALGIDIDEVWFIENKISKNRDKSPQLNAYKITMDPDTVKLYDALLYEPLRRMLQAISDPDYVYLINESDNFVDKAEIYEFWSQTMIAEIDDFNIPESKKDLMARRLKKIRDASLAIIDPKVIKKFKENASEFIQYNLTNKNMTNQEKIEHTLRTLGIIVKVDHKFDGYSSDTYLLKVSSGTNIASVFRYKLDIANALNVSSIRIKKELFVLDNESYVAIESPKAREKDLLFDLSYLNKQKIPIGMDNFGSVIYWDMNNPSTPHVLICGATGSGKTVSIISTIAYAKLAGVEKIVIFDPKFEFKGYNDNSVSVYNHIEDIEKEMADLVIEMNLLVKSGKSKKTLVIFDEFADAVSASRKGKELEIREMVKVGFYAPRKGPNGGTLPLQPKMKLKKTGEHKSLEENLKILLQKGRSSGFRIVAATQRASVKVITGDAKVNFPVQICFRVPKEVDSKVVIDESGAESLAGKGDGLIRSPEYMDVVRFQAFYKN